VRELLGSRRAASLALVAVFWVVLRGFYLNAHFLLYPFRGMSAVFFIVTGYLLFFKAVAGARVRARVMCGAGLAFMAAAAIREPSVLAMAGVLAWYVFAAGPTRAAKARGLAWFVLPWFVGLAAWMALSPAAGRFVTRQTVVWLRNVFGSGEGRLLAQFGGNAGTMFGFALDELRWYGLVLVLLGLWRTRSNARYGAGFGVTAVLFFLFYAVCKAHRRYFIPVLLFGSMYVGPGIDALLAACADRVSAAKRERVLRCFTLAAIVALAAGTLAYVARLESWGPRMTFDQALHFCRTLDSVAGPEDRIYVDRRCRIMQDAVASLVRVRLGSPRLVARDLQDGRRCFLARALNRACYRDADRVAHRGMTPDRITAHWGDLVALAGEQGEPLELAIGEARFALFEIRPHQARTVTQDVRLEPGVDSVVWMNLGACLYSAAKHVELSSVDDDTLGGWEIRRGNGWQAVFVEGARVRGTGGVLRVTSEVGLPAALDARCTADGEFMDFHGDMRRDMAFVYWFSKNLRQPWGTKYGLVLAEEPGRVRLPVIRGAPYSNLVVRITVSPMGRSAELAGMSWRMGDRVIVAARGSKRVTKRFTQDLLLPMGDGDDHLIVDMDLDFAEGGARGLKVHAFGIKGQ
jgi:hypothetical protein